MKTNLIITIGLALTVSAFNVIAQGGPGCYGRGGPAGAGQGGPGGPHRYGAQQLPPMLALMLDIDKDGVLSAQEFGAAPNALATLDKNKDGQLTIDELCPGGSGRGGRACPFSQTGRGGPPAGVQPLVLAIFDADGDGVVSTQEQANAAVALQKLDANNDGQLTADEIRPPGRGLRNGTGPQAQMGLCPLNSTQTGDNATPPPQESRGWGRGQRNGTGPRAQAGICPFAAQAPTK